MNNRDLVSHYQRVKGVRDVLDGEMGLLLDEEDPFAAMKFKDFIQFLDEHASAVKAEFKERCKTSQSNDGQGA